MLDSIHVYVHLRIFILNYDSINLGVAESNSRGNLQDREMKRMANSTFTAHLTSTDMAKIHSITLGGYQSTAVCPPPMTKDFPGTTSPHQLFLASIGACVNLVFEIALEKARIKLLDLHSEIVGHYDTDEESGQSRFTVIEVTTKATVTKGVNGRKVRRLYEVAHDNCPIGNCLIGSCVKLVTNLDIAFR